MLFYCYFIARWQPALQSAPFPAVEGQPVSFVRLEDLAAAVRQVPAAGRFTPGRVLEYNAILAGASRQGIPVLALPFGAVFRSENALVRMLGERRQELLKALDQLAGKAEVAVRLVLAGDVSADTKAAEIGRISGALDSRAQLVAGAAGEMVLEVAHLVDGREAPSHLARLKEQGLAACGPRPPFRFLPAFLRQPVGRERRAGRERQASQSRSA